MEITAQKIQSIELKFLQDEDEEIDDITPFITSLEKLKKHINSVGFSNLYNKEEKALWNSIFDALLGETEIKVEGLNSTGVSIVNIQEDI